MKILLLHNYYQQPGGEDVVFKTERASLEQAGHEVLTYEKDNKTVVDLTWQQNVKLAQQTIWSREVYEEVSDLIRRHQPQIAHFVNFFPLISPSAYYACHQAGVPVIQSLQNYRLLCLGATFIRNKAVCHDCLGKLPWRGVLHRCYRDSRIQSAVLFAMLSTHRGMQTWQKKVDAFIALNYFMQQKMEVGGILPEKIFVKPNALPSDPGVRQNALEYAVFIGRLSQEKGVHTLISTWEHFEQTLLIVGDGPEKSALQASVHSRNVEFLGWLPNADVIAKLKQARFLIFPSEWYEGLPITLIEAFACGVPVIVSKIGGLAELVEHGVTGLHFAPGNVDALQEQIQWAFAHPEQMEQMGRNGRKQYETHYTTEANYQKLIHIYHAVLVNR